MFICQMKQFEYFNTKLDVQKVNVNHGEHTTSYIFCVYIKQRFFQQLFIISLH